jgi:polysaccharide pyruvyl transferase WcaK-like protein
MRVLLVHAYSAANAGDGLLVSESLGLVREALGKDARIAVAALHPETFAALADHVVDLSPRRREGLRGLWRLRHWMREADLILGVGGGYLRAGTPAEGAKALLAHGPQLLGSLLSRTPHLYLPQSVGPFRGVSGRILRFLARRARALHLRDDRSMHELAPSAGTARTPDLALMAPGAAPQDLDAAVHARPVLTVRAVRGSVPPGVMELDALLPPHDSYVQSRGGGNDDLRATQSLDCRSILDRDQYLDPSRPRVVVAVRLHAALMALNAGHWVIHLAYERKGFGAFQDLGLERYVHNVNDFDPGEVAEQVRLLTEDPGARQGYARSVAAARLRAAREREQLVEEIRQTAEVLPA